VGTGSPYSSAPNTAYQKYHQIASDGQYGAIVTSGRDVAGQSGHIRPARIQRRADRDVASTPTKASNTARVHCTITGTGFNPSDTQVKLSEGSTPVNVTGTLVIVNDIPSRATST